MWDRNPAVDWASAGVEGAPSPGTSPTGSPVGDTLVVVGVIAGLVVLALIVHALNVRLD